MKALTDKIIDILEQRSNDALNESEKRAINNCILIIKNQEKSAEFEEVARVVMKHLCDTDKYHPHHRVVLDCTMAELSEGVKCTGKVMDYVN